MLIDLPKAASIGLVIKSLAAVDVAFIPLSVVLTIFSVVSAVIIPISFRNVMTLGLKYLVIISVVFAKYLNRLIPRKANITITIITLNVLLYQKLELFCVPIFCDSVLFIFCDSVLFIVGIDSVIGGVEVGFEKD